jgi:voltage-gated potassium channel
VPPVLVGFGLSGALFDMLVTVLMLAAILSLCFQRQQRTAALCVGIPSVLFSLAGYAVSGSLSKWGLFVGHLCQILFFMGASGLIIRSMFRARTLTGDSISGAICGYLFVGLAWGVLYSMVETFRPGSFEVSPSLGVPNSPTHSLRHVLTYYSFVTLTTVGYGDVIPRSAATRTCAWLEAIVGQFYMAVIVAGLVSMLAARGGRPPSNRGETP